MSAGSRPSCRAAAARILGMDPASIAYLRLAADLKIGVADLEAVDVHRISLA